MLELASACTRFIDLRNQALALKMGDRGLGRTRPEGAGH
jgi:hypothetical protein